MRWVRAAALSSAISLAACHTLFGYGGGAPVAAESGASNDRDAVPEQARARDGSPAGELTIGPGEGGAGHTDGGSSTSCDPKKQFCKANVTVGATLYDISGTATGTTIVAVGEDVVTTRRQSSWTVEATSVTWRGVHVVSDTTIWMVGNDAKEARARRIDDTGAIDVPVDKASTFKQLNAVWMSSPALGWVAGETVGGYGVLLKATPTGIIGGGTSTGQGKALLGVSSSWSVGRKGEILHLEGGLWKPHPVSLPDTVELRSVVDVPFVGAMCTVGEQSASGYVTCCVPQLACVLDANAAAKLAPLNDLALTLSAGITMWLVGAGGVTRVNVLTTPWKLVTPIQVSAGTSAALRAVWATADGKQIWIAGDGGTLHYHTP
jgi:hypothetical protein